MHVRWHGSIVEIGGYGKANINLLSALQNNGVTISLVPDEMDCTNNSVIQKMIDKKLADDVPTIYFTPPCRNDFGKLGKGKQLCFTMLETDNIPDSWAEAINKMLVCIVPSSNNQKVFSKKIKIPIEICPLGIDPENYKPGSSMTGFPDGKIKFLTVTEIVDRKNLDLLLERFLQVFKYKDDVLFMLKVFYKSDFQEYAENLIKKYSCDKIIFINRRFSELEMASLYNSADYYITMANEAFNMPLLEALACGVPSIVLDETGHMDFCDRDFVRVVKANIVKANSINEVYAGSNWLVPNLEYLNTELLYAYLDKDSRRNSAKVYSNKIRSQYSWDNVAKTFIQKIKGYVYG